MTIGAANAALELFRLAQIFYPKKSGLNFQ